MLRVIFTIYISLLSLGALAQVDFPCKTDGCSNIIMSDGIVNGENNYYILNKQVKQAGENTKTSLILQIFEKTTNKNRENIQISLPITNIASVSNLKVKDNEIMFILNSCDEFYFVKCNISKPSLPIFFKIEAYSNLKNTELFDYLLVEQEYIIIPVRISQNLILLKYNSNGEKIAQQVIYKLAKNTQGIKIYTFNSRFLLTELCLDDKTQSPTISMHIFSIAGQRLHKNSIQGCFSDLIYDKERKMLIVALNQSNNIKLPEIHALFLNENLKIEKDILLLKDKICDFFSAKLAKFDENSYIYSCVWTNLITVKFNKYNTLKLYEKKLNACIDSVVALLPTPNSITYILSLEVFERKTNSTIKDYCIFTERL